jgi:hypothetical protein
MVSAVSGGARLRMGAGVGPAVTGFFGPHPARIKQEPSRLATKQVARQAFLMPSVFALPRPLVDGNLDYTAVDILSPQSVARGAWVAAFRGVCSPRVSVVGYFGFLVPNKV